jgi:SAM-dependent methyltransferase
LNSSLDLYAKIEPMIGFYDEYEELYSSYLQIISSLHVENILDVGCGNGRFLKHLKEQNYKHLGIDKSKEMIKRANLLGVNAKVLDLNEIESKSFDCVVSIGDVINYIKDQDLDSFFVSIGRVLKDDGYFLCDINTKNGFEVTDGIMVKDSEDKFLSIEANFENEILKTNITLFEKQNEYFKKYSGEILQYFHHFSRFKNIPGFKLISKSLVGMFEYDDEKILMLFKKAT